MSLKMKLTSTIIAFMLLASMLIVGVFAVKQTEFSVGGNIVFNASGINATISAGTLSDTGSWKTGDGADKMKAVEINTEKSASELAEEYITWSNLDLMFNETGDDVSITFTITNNSQKAEEELIAYININNGESSNAVATVSNVGAIIAPDTDNTIETENVETFVITFKTIDKDVNASLEGFKINFDIRYATVEADSATSTTLSYQGITYNIESNNTLTATGYTTAPTNYVIPAYIKNGDTKYTVTTIGENAFTVCSSLVSVSFPNTLQTIKNLAFKGCPLTNLVLPSNLTLESFAFSISCYCLVIPENTTLLQSVFDGAEIEVVIIPDDMTTIPRETFNYCEKLKTIVLPAGVTKIEEQFTTGGGQTFATILFKGTEEQWNAIDINQNDSEIKNANIVFNYK